jgi:tetratricopeptide (TPR) repeat protein/predicted Ser/Thr protein kinase
MRFTGQIVGGRYQIERHIGAGGMGEVYLATDPVLGRRVAVKVLPAENQTDPTARERLRREARAAAGLDHPFICKIHEVGEAGDESFIVMEYIDGETLHQLAARSLLPTRQILDIAYALAQALEEAHTRGLTHRDLKPGNIMLTRQGHVKVLDFGLAKQASAGAATDSTGGGTVLTDPGTRIGTPAYMSPEQILGGSVDPRSDIFSLGVIVHEMVTGSHPFRRATPADTMAAVLRDPPAAGGRDLEAVPGLRAVIQRMLAKACAERFQTMAELRAEFESLRERSWLSTPSATPAVATAHPLPAERTPFVSREAELAELRSALDRMLLGHGGIVLIGGEPGVGKTRLVRELQREARQRGCMTLTGHCYEMEGSPPFVPFVEYMEEAARLVPQAFRAALGEDASEIAAILPGLRRLFPDIPLPLEVPPDHQRRVAFNAMLQFLQRATIKSPSVLLFDDLHWADEPTLQLIQHLAPHMTATRTLMVGTYRDVELDVKKPFARTLEALVRQRMARRLSLRRLTATDVEQMLARMSGSPAPASVVRVVFHETEGNPFFIEEVYQHLSEEGRLFDAAGKWRDDLRADELDVPESVKLVVGRRLERLGEAARKLLTAAAVIGRTFPLDLLQAVVESGAEATLEAIEEAERATLLSAVAGREARYGFVHELIRTTLTSGLSLPRRQRLHLKIADAIERLRGAALDAHLSALAHHLYQAGAAADLGRTSSALLRAAQQAQTSGAFEEVLEVTEQLLSLELSAGDRTIAAALECKGNALQALGRSAEARTALDEAYHLYELVRDPAGIERTTIALGLILTWRGDINEGYEVFRRGLAQFPSPSSRSHVLLKAEMILPLAGQNRFEEASAQLREILAAGDVLAESGLAARVLSLQGEIDRLAANYEEQLKYASQALERLPSRAHWHRADALWVTAFGHYYCARFDAAEAAAQLAETEARRSGHRGALWAIDVARTNIRLLRSGDLAAAIADYQRISNERWNFLNEVLTGIFNAYLGNRDAALRGLHALNAMPMPQQYLSGVGPAAEFAAAALFGDRDLALTKLPAARAWLPEDRPFNSQGRWSAAMGIISGLAYLGESEQLAALDPLARRIAGRGHLVDTLSLGPDNGDLCAGLTAAASGETDRAARHYERALATARSAPNRLLEPTVQYWYGRLDIDRQRQDSARTRLQAARDSFTGLRMIVHRDLADRALVQASR